MLEGRNLSQSTREVLLTLGLEAKSLLQELLIEYSEQSKYALRARESDFPVVAHFTFDAKPTVDLITLLGWASSHSGTNGENAPVTIGVKEGSYVEIVATALFTVAAFQMLLFLLNGCIFQIVEIRARLEVLSSPKLAKPLKQRALSPPRDVPVWLMDPMKHLIGAMVKGIIPLDLPQKGFDFQNIKGIQLDAQPPGLSR
jgi:hypothetical protein